MFTEKEKTIMNEAFMTGRVYSSMGEKENPIEIHKKLEENCEKALKRESNSGAGVSYMPFPDDRSRLYAALRCIETTIEKNKADWWKIEKINKIIAECKRPLKRKGI